MITHNFDGRDSYGQQMLEGDDYYVVFGVEDDIVTAPFRVPDPVEPEKS